MRYTYTGALRHFTIIFGPSGFFTESAISAVSRGFQSQFRYGLMDYGSSYGTDFDNCEIRLPIDWLTKPPKSKLFSSIQFYFFGFWVPIT